MRPETLPARQDERLFQVWSERDPPDAWEQRRQQRIKRLQGVENAHVTDALSAER